MKKKGATKKQFAYDNVNTINAIIKKGHST